MGLPDGKKASVVPILPLSSDSVTTASHEHSAQDHIKGIIRSMGLKVTGPRLIILQCLSECQKSHDDRHVTAQALYEKCHRKDKSIGFATVYRFLRDLSDHQYITEVRMGGQPSRYELAPKKHHDHLTCTSCGKIIEFENSKIEKIQEQVAAHFGFKLTGHVLELYGVCPNCQGN